MRAACLSLVLLSVIGFSLGTDLTGWYEHWSGGQGKSPDVLTVLLGDSRRLFARHIYAKADAYFHNGYYPSMFDQRPEGGQLHMASVSHGESHHEDAASEYLSEPTDWIDRFSRHFFPSEHRHLGEAPKEHDGHHEDHPGSEREEASQQREVLPWLRLAAELDPERPETYVVAAYWLRAHLNKTVEAEQFLREGLRANPGNPEILFELGRIYRENRHDPDRSRNLWELCLASLAKQQSSTVETNLLLQAQVLGQLARLEEEQQRFSESKKYLQALLPLSPNKAHIQKWIDELGTKAPPGLPAVKD